MTLLDIHCHGAVGSEFGGDGEGSRQAATYHRDEGVARVVASLVSGPHEQMVQAVAVLAPLVADGTLAGVHSEGPFLADARRGAHDPAALRDPDVALVEAMAAAADEGGAPGALKHLTFAPERPGRAGLLRSLAEYDILPAVGHTDAEPVEIERALGEAAETSGRAPLVTHLFNGMRPFHHRDGGAVAPALAAAGRGEAFVELIADGVHVAPEVVRMVFETVGPERVVLVSDAMSATGLGDGQYRLGSLSVTVEGGVARLSDAGSIAGSTSTLADCVRWAVEVAGVDEGDAYRSASDTPARALRL
ncbi:hypothetical protein GCM10022199_08800 [Marihabitans asiaticum]|uniref:N-acetylglucosamine 6-phosphate deacetylase n=1 Tax=Marihabitans asiaticum TaxID=415218 RepID=A0A560WH57_9MICO|nr:N-acetylglucosamine-6-phosphate deacetylase [Marihabitans asiaticum]TWD16908.1 N-acetylglucosamine 6-phosphate deacetylase [Marihabitans asiaticum]